MTPSQSVELEAAVERLIFRANRAKQRSLVSISLTPDDALDICAALSASNARALAAEEAQAWLRDRADAMAKDALTHKPDSKARAFVQGRAAGLEDALAFLRTTLASMKEKDRG